MTLKSQERGNGWEERKGCPNPRGGRRGIGGIRRGGGRRLRGLGGGGGGGGGLGGGGGRGGDGGEGKALGGRCRG